ncbi:MAG: arginase [Firmicutes bacterium]|nr:arginase [Bacillota bacterium]
MTKYIDIIGSQMDLGAVRKGVDMGPSAIRHAGLIEKIERIGYTVKDKGDVVPAVAVSQGDPKLRYEKEINASNEQLFRKVKESLDEAHFPLILGGDHSIAAGSVSAVSQHYGNIGILWIDAHGDFNDDRITLTGNMHGMPLSAVCGLGPDSMVSFSSGRVDPSHVAIIGARDIDPEEKIKLRKNGISVYSISDIHTMGIYEILVEALDVVSNGTCGIHLSLDMDAIDPEYAPGTGTPVPNGMTLRETYLAVELVRKSGKLLSMDVVEVNPLLDIKNKTGILASDLIQTALGSTEY